MLYCVNGSCPYSTVGINIFDKITISKKRKERKSVNVEMKFSARNNLGLKPKQAEVISVEVENSLWEKYIIGSANPECLSRTVFYFIGLRLLRCIRSDPPKRGWQKGFDKSHCRSTKRRLFRFRLSLWVTSSGIIWLNQ